ncbi:MAG: PD-(D/E)XK nuclease family protein [Candidatus Pacearchaeota archaeon]|nr:PD-(D/E)XK nuclease family protein [Candidatus Pacearchaeota archaeon]
MEFGKECENKISLNLSPSSINTYYQSPLLFYLKYIAKVPDDTSVPVCYGLSGNIVHECLEKYAKKELDRRDVCSHLLIQWKKQNLHIHEDIYGNLLDQSEYIRAVIKGMELIDQHEDYICEETILFPLKENEIMKIGIKGIIDLQAIEKKCNQHVILDYKTSNSVSKDKNFERQALFYNLLLYKKKNILPSKTSLHYLKLGVSTEYVFSLEEIEEFERELHKIADIILLFGVDIKNYPIGQIDDRFNSKKQACLREVERRKNELR